MAHRFKKGDWLLITENGDLHNHVAKYVNATLYGLCLVELLRPPEGYSKTVNVDKTQVKWISKKAVPGSRVAAAPNHSIPASVRMRFSSVGQSSWDTVVFGATNGTNTTSIRAVSINENGNSVR